MFDLLKLLYDNSPSLTHDMECWFEHFPSGAAWNVYSDYCVGNMEKANDSFSFVITLKHDTDQNLSEYIAHVAPKDLKKTRQASEGLISYLNSPVSFSVTFIVERESKLLRQFITDENMSDFCKGLRDLVCMWATQPGADADYWQRIDQALAAFETDSKRKKFNSKLARQILLTATFAGFLFATLNKLKHPMFIRWITDRDATFERYNQIAFDMSFIFFLLLRAYGGEPHEPDRPRFLFAFPFMDGEAEYAEQVRLADYLAGLCADIKLPGIEFSHRKFETIFGSAIVNSTNNVVLEVLGNGEKITTRRLHFTGE